MDFSRAMVTGGAGFIGSHLVDELLRQGLDVVSVDDYSMGKCENLEVARSYQSFKDVKCDVTDRDALHRHFEGVDIVFHNAASKKTVSLKNPVRDLEVNAKGTFNVLELAREFGVKKLIHASTGSVYGEPRYFPQDENHPIDPVSYYGVSKLAGEKYARAFEKLYDMDVTVLRYFHVYGPRQDSSDVGGVVPIFIRRALRNEPPVIFGDGNQQRSFTYVGDVVRANLFVAGRADTKGQVYNCASGIRITIGQLAEEVLRRLGRDYLQIEYGPWAPGDIKVFEVDNSRLKGLGFEWQTAFSEGLDQTIAWFRQKLGQT
jgi:UDP-glucose 4-epimerase